MEYRPDNPHFYKHPPPHHHHHQEPYPPSYSYYSNSNPNPVPAMADAGVPRLLPDHHAVPLASYYLGAPGGEEKQCPIHPFSYRAGKMKKGDRKASLEDLETKRRKLISEGTAADSVRVCLACNIVCNSDTVFAAHLAGEKHALKVLGKSSNGSFALIPAFPTHVKPQKVKKAVKKGLKKTAKVVSSSLYCEVCKLECNSQDAFTNHTAGKRHKKNLRKLLQPAAAKPSTTPTAKTVGPAVADQVKPVGENGIKSTLAIGEDEEIKIQKILDEEGATNGARACAVCNILCNSQTAFDSHVAGRRHLSLLKQQLAVGPTGDDEVKLEGEKQGKKAAAAAAGEEDLESKKQKILEAGTAADEVRVCTLCCVVFNSQTMFDSHVAGRKCIAKVKQELTDNIVGPAGADQVKPVSQKVDVADQVKPVGQKVTPGIGEEDMETKKQRVLDAGAAVSEVRVCTVCAVVCNSQLVFDSHVAGRKHAARMKQHPPVLGS